jgi:hypothetical protein
MKISIIKITFYEKAHSSFGEQMQAAPVVHHIV